MENIFLKRCKRMRLVEEKKKGRGVLVLSKYLNGLPRWLNGKEFTCQAGDMGTMSGLGRFLEKEIATYSSILAWKIP